MINLIILTTIFAPNLCKPPANVGATTAIRLGSLGIFIVLPLSNLYDFVSSFESDLPEPPLLPHAKTMIRTSKGKINFS